MNELLEILQTINPALDYTKETRLIDGKMLDSLSILDLVSEIEDHFDVEITPSELIPANFNSADAMMRMIQRLQEDR